MYDEDFNMDYRAYCRMMSGASARNMPFIPPIEVPLTEPAFRDKLGLIDSLLVHTKTKKEIQEWPVISLDYISEDKVYIMPSEMSLI